MWLENSYEAENISRQAVCCSLKWVFLLLLWLTSDHRLNTWRHSTFHRIHFLSASRMISCNWPCKCSMLRRRKKECPLQAPPCPYHCIITVQCQFLIDFSDLLLYKSCCGKSSLMGICSVVSRVPVIQISWKSLK